jgi:hypothetical protein
VNWLWIVLHGASISAAMLAGVCLGSALCNRRWSERCSRCQTLMGRIHTTPANATSARRGDAGC